MVFMFLLLGNSLEDAGGRLQLIISLFHYKLMPQKPTKNYKKINFSFLKCKSQGEVKSSSAAHNECLLPNRGLAVPVPTDAFRSKLQNSSSIPAQLCKLHAGHSPTTVTCSLTGSVLSQRGQNTDMILKETPCKYCGKTALTVTSL